MNLWLRRDKAPKDRFRNKDKVASTSRPALTGRFCSGKSNHDSLRPKRPSGRSKRGNCLRLNRGRIVSPKRPKIPFLSRAIEMQQVCLVARRVITKPAVNISDANLMKQRKSVARGFTFVGNNGGKQIFTHWRLIPLAKFKQRGVRIPLPGVPKKVPQQEQALFRTDGVINMDFRAVEVARQRIGNIPGHDADSVGALQMILRADRIFVERNFRQSISCGAQINILKHLSWLAAAGIVTGCSAHDAGGERAPSIPALQQTESA